MGPGSTGDGSASRRTWLRTTSKRGKMGAGMSGRRVQPGESSANLQTWVVRQLSPGRGH